MSNIGREALNLILGSSVRVLDLHKSTIRDRELDAAHSEKITRQCWSWKSETRKVH